MEQPLHLTSCNFIGEVKKRDVTTRPALNLAFAKVARHQQADKQRHFTPRVTAKKSNLSSESAVPCTALSIPSARSCVCTGAVTTGGRGHLLVALCFLANASGRNVLCLSSREQKCLLQPHQLRCHDSSSSPSSLVMAVPSPGHKPLSQQNAMVVAV